VARVIFDAATDGTDRLRYAAASDIEPLVKARRESCEEDYMASIRSQFEESGMRLKEQPERIKGERERDIGSISVKSED